MLKFVSRTSDRWVSMQIEMLLNSFDINMCWNQRKKYALYWSITLRFGGCGCFVTEDPGSQACVQITVLICEVSAH